MEKLLYQLLEQLGEDPDREGLKDTPNRMAKSLQYLTQGYHQNPKDIIKNAIFNE